MCEKREKKLYISSAPNKVRFESILFLGEISFNKFAQKMESYFNTFFQIINFKKLKKNCLIVGLVTSSEFVVVLDIHTQCVRCCGVRVRMEGM